MLDMFGPSPSKIAEVVREEQEHRVALLIVLLEKSVVSIEEYQSALLKAKSELEQFAAQRREEFLATEEGKSAAFFERVFAPKETE